MLAEEDYCIDDFYSKIITGRRLAYSLRKIGHLPDDIKRKINGIIKKEQTNQLEIRRCLKAKAKEPG